MPLKCFWCYIDSHVTTVFFLGLCSFLLQLFAVLCCHSGILVTSQLSSKGPVMPASPTDRFAQGFGAPTHLSNGFASCHSVRRLWLLVRAAQPNLQSKMKFPAEGIRVFVKEAQGSGLTPAATHVPLSHTPPSPKAHRSNAQTASLTLNPADGDGSSSKKSFGQNVSVKTFGKNVFGTQTLYNFSKP